MAGLGLICLILAGILVLQATVVKSEDNPVGAEVQMEAKPTGAVSRIADQPASLTAESLSDESREEAETPAAIRRLGKHKSSDKSVAGGGVIIGGLLTATLAAVFCYIRVTRRKNPDQCGH